MISKHFEHNSCCSRIGENDLGAARIGLAVSFGKNGETTRPPPLPSPQGGGEHFVPALSAICGRSGEEGTTLLELLVAIALLALLCTYSFDAIRHLQSFNRAIREIEDANSIEAVAAHMRRTIAGSRVAFFTAPGSQARLAFMGEESRIALVADADNRLEDEEAQMLAKAIARLSKPAPSP